ncbi:MAG: hypothetical protein KDF65_11205 [Anaerolineae bacterium]|nr:hypothetical protein [Anaerolineae bacterium]
MKEPGIRKALLFSSFFRTGNALLIAAIIVITGFLSLILLPLLFTPLAGVIAAAGGALLLLLAEAVFLYRSVNDEAAHSEAVAAMLEPKVNFEPTKIEDKILNDKLNKALEYWSLIDETIAKVPQGVLRDRLTKTVSEATHWLQAVYNLAERVDKFQQNSVIDRDLKSVPESIQDYERKLAKERSPQVRDQLERTIADKKRQLQTLENLQDNMEKATYQLDSTISSLGTIYSQLLLVGNKDEEGSRVNRLQAEISEQVQQLEDLTEAMDEVYERSI